MKVCLRLSIGCLASFFLASTCVLDASSSKKTNTEHLQKASGEAEKSGVKSTLTKAQHNVKKTFSELNDKLSGLFKKKSKVEEEAVEDEDALPATALDTPWGKLARHLTLIASTPSSEMHEDYPHYLSVAEASCIAGEVPNLPHGVGEAIKKGLPIWEWPLSDEVDQTMVDLAWPADVSEDDKDAAVIRIWARFLGIEEVLDLPKDPLFKEQGYKAVELLKDLTHTISGNKKLERLHKMDKSVDGGLGRVMERIANWGLAIQDKDGTFNDYIDRRGDEWIIRLIAQLRKAPATPESKAQQTTWITEALSSAIMDGHGAGFQHMFELLPSDFQALCANIQIGDLKRPLLVAGYELLGKASPEMAERFRATYSKFLPLAEHVATLVKGLAASIGKIAWGAIMKAITEKTKQPQTAQ